ncbi:MAG: glycosyltransferase [Candidatus Nezhaarchaeota archaeon]|nr:glycosyltransferase [Candidatus Nezhaarchaeota archaeon]
MAYYWYARSRWLPRPWDIKLDSSYRPRVSIIIPTHREAKLIEARLDNVYGQDYPKDLVEVIVIDSGSDDGTPELVEKWAGRHSGLVLKLIREEARKGKAQALNHALKYTSGEAVVIADADALWPSDALTKVVRWLSDPSVGAVSCLKRPLGSGATRVEESYRQHYNVLRVAESKAYSTPIFHGELSALRASLLKEVGGFPTDVGADDSHVSTKIALRGFRAIIPDDLWVEEKVPRESYSSWRIRRAQHLIQHFSKMLRARGGPRKFKRILLIESYLHLANPWILAAATVLLVASAVAYNSLVSWTTLASGLLLLALKPYRTWITTQLYLIAGAIRNLYSREIVWTKQSK